MPWLTWASGTARITYIVGVVAPLEIKQAVRDAGYEASERAESSQAASLDRERHTREDEIHRQGRNLLIAGMVGLIIMIGTFYDMLGPLKAILPQFLSYKWEIGLLMMIVTMSIATSEVKKRTMRK